MEHQQTSVPDRPTQPQELPLGLELAYESVYDRAHIAEATSARRTIRRMLESGTGLLAGVDEHGRYITYNTADLWSILTDSEEAADLTVLLAVVALDADPVIFDRAKKFLTPLIAAFVEEHANNMAKRVADLYFIESSAR